VLGIGIDDVAIHLNFVQSGIRRLGHGFDLGTLAQTGFDQLLDRGFSSLCEGGTTRERQHDADHRCHFLHVHSR